MLVDPSPKLQDQVVGLPVEASVKATVWPVVGALGEKVKAATGFEDVGFVVDEEVTPPPQPPRTKLANTKKASVQIFIGICLRCITLET